MINNDRIVPITAISLLDIYGSVCKQMAAAQSIDMVKLSISGAPGIFEVEEAGVYFCDEPVKHLEIAAAADPTGVFFVPAYDFEGISIGGVEQDLTAYDIQPDGRSLYQAQASSGSVAVSNEMLA